MHCQVNIIVLHCAQSALDDLPPVGRHFPLVVAANSADDNFSQAFDSAPEKNIIIGKKLILFFKSFATTINSRSFSQ